MRILGDSIRWTFWASLAAMVVILAMGRPLLSLFGPRFVEEAINLMFILAVGLMARAAVGPVERLLNMVGEQRACAAVYGTAFMLNLVLCIVLIPRLGVEGAAVSTSIALTGRIRAAVHRDQAAARIPRLRLGPPEGALECTPP